MLTARSSEFKKYGEIIEGNFEDVVEYLHSNSPMPEQNNLYVRDDLKMHNLISFLEIKNKVYKNKETEIGYCNGYNSKLNCLEYHNGIEVDIAATDLVLLLALQEDVHDGVIDSKDVKAFYIKKGEAVILYSGVFHFSPCKLSDSGFKCAIILPDGTNKDLEKPSEDKKYWKENKWLYAHKDTNQAKLGAYIGIIGENIEVKY